MISVFLLCFTESVLGKMEQKNVKNKGMPRPFKCLSIERGFRPSAHYAMNYSAVNQIRQSMSSSEFFCFICYLAVVDFWAVI